MPCRLFFFSQPIQDHNAGFPFQLLGGCGDSVPILSETENVEMVWDGDGMVTNRLAERHHISIHIIPCRPDVSCLLLRMWECIKPPGTHDSRRLELWGRFRCHFRFKAYSRFESIGSIGSWSLCGLPLPLKKITRVAPRHRYWCLQQRLHQAVFVRYREDDQAEG